MTEEGFKIGVRQVESAPRSGSLSGEEVAELRDLLQFKLAMKQQAAEREAMMNQPSPVRNWITPQEIVGQVPPISGPREVARALPHLPSGWANGFKTSEFWTAVAGAGLALAKGYGYNIPEDAFWSIVAYIIGRSGMKAAAAYRSGIKQ